MIVAAAITKDGVTFSMPAPSRHHHIINKMAEMDIDAAGATQGFLTANGVFVNRTKAMRIAKLTSQIINTISYKGPELFSEHVW